MHPAPAEVPVVALDKLREGIQVEASRGWVVNGIVESFRA
jgi:hypothetical protein